MVNGIIQSNLRHKCLVYFYTSPKDEKFAFEQEAKQLSHQP